jgi:hypothetical protein
MTWTNEPEFEGGEGREITCNGQLVATVYDPADADLIAAAPDLLAALHGADEFCQQGINSENAARWETALYDIRELVRTSIAKAKGA